MGIRSPLPAIVRLDRLSACRDHDTERATRRRIARHAGAEWVARFLSAMKMEMTVLAKACGRSSAHNLEKEDLRAPSLEAFAFAGVKMA